jgi:uncharacterized peroxidase-related enzyme
MPYINIENDLPGIRGLMAYRKETAQPLTELANTLLRDRNGLSPAERELIATRVSYLNDCFYCQTSHGAIASQYLDGNDELVDQVKKDFDAAPISDKLKALLTIATKVQHTGKAVSQQDIDEARTSGASDMDIHDAVLIAAAFCMYNRYVDGLGALTPDDLASYTARAKQVAENGYTSRIFSTQQPIERPGDHVGSEFPLSLTEK